MKIYIAYKYRYHDNKKALQSDLIDLADFFVAKGHTAFILGRDVQQWHSLHHSKLSTLVEIIKNIGKHDTLFVFNDSSVHSNGLPVELILAKCLGLKIIFATKTGVTPGIFAKFTKQHITFLDLADLKSKVQQYLN